MKPFKSMCSPEIREKAATNKDHSKKRWEGYGRAYEDPEALVAAISNPSHRLAAKIELEGGCRAEGVGFARSPFSPSAITIANLNGIKADPYFDDSRLAGEIETAEKGGYRCKHYITVETYLELEDYLHSHRVLKGSYRDYLNSVIKAAKMTGQYVPGRGTHGLKHCFAQRFYEQAIVAGKTNARAELETSRRCSHHRGDVFILSYSGRGKR